MATKQQCSDCAKQSTCQKVTHFENYNLDGCSDFLDIHKTCKDCAHFLGMGDWDLCCTEHHEGYPLGFLCYEDTPACEKFDEKEIIECDGRCLNCDYYDTSDCPDRK